MPFSLDMGIYLLRTFILETEQNSYCLTHKKMLYNTFMALFSDFLWEIAKKSAKNVLYYQRVVFHRLLWDEEL